MSTGQKYNTVGADNGGVLGSSETSASHSPDEVVKEAESFINIGSQGVTDGEII